MASSCPPCGRRNSRGRTWSRKRARHFPPGPDWTPRARSRKPGSPTSARPGLDAARPEPETRFPNLFLAGDWTRTGWPATMEGAVRSGYRAAEAIAGRRFLLPDIA
ncbi:MAG: FAD-dependent oxidoreductase [Acidobacteria bacterium]|nr:FAD-dependent oxidoreductase [Acidobacteriota bacterium]